MDGKEQVELCKEMELLLEYTEGKLTRAEYDVEITKLEDKREELLRQQGLLAEDGNL